MICGNCGETVSAGVSKCNTCGQSPLLREVYRLDAIVGRGAAGITYRGTRLADDSTVAIKELPFRQVDSPKTKAMFEREARVLRQLSHPQIPAYLDDFTAGVGKHLSLYLVQEYAAGQTLTEEMAERRYREDEVLEIISEVLTILAYLHSLEPPVIHRDIKLSNVIRRGSSGELVLIDFGAVRDLIQDPQLGGSTIAGTYGFMAPEQYEGRAAPASDIYGLGVLALCLLSRQEPTAMLSEGRLDWRAHVRVHPATADLLEAMLQPKLERRPAHARHLAERVQQAIERVHRGEIEPEPEPEPAPEHAALAPAWL